LFTDHIDSETFDINVTMQASQGEYSECASWKLCWFKIYINMFF